MMSVLPVLVACVYAQAHLEVHYLAKTTLKMIVATGGELQGAIPAAFLMPTSLNRGF